MYTIYLVEDDANIRELIAYALNNNGYKAEGFYDAQHFYEALDRVHPSLVLLDIMLDDEVDGYAILKHLKSNPATKKIPVIMLTAKTSELDKVKGLDMGADDYVTKPFGVMELLSRVRAVLRRFPSEKEIEEKSQLVYQSITMDLEKRTVEVSGQKIKLTYKEFELLTYMVNNADIVLSRDKLMNEIWGFEYQGESRTVDVHIRTLRQKLGDAGSYIKTVRNVGYKIGV